MDLRLFVDREDDGMGRRIDIKPDHVAQLVGELRVVGELELLDPVRLEVYAPDTLDGTGAIASDTAPMLQARAHRAGAKIAPRRTRASTAAVVPSALILRSNVAERRNDIVEK
jgi:hypothetical protein